MGVLGVSMGGHAALDFTRSFSGRVRSICCIAGYYDEDEVENLAWEIRDIPLLLVHRHGDRCCPFRSIKKLYYARDKMDRNRWMSNKKYARHEKYVATCQGWFSAGTKHSATSKELEDATKWLRQW